MGKSLRAAIAGDAEDIVLAADIAFYNALEAQATLQVAKSTSRPGKRRRSGQCINCEQAQVHVDQSFAQVNLSQANCSISIRKISSMPQWRISLRCLEPRAITVQLVDDPSPPCRLHPQRTQLLLSPCNSAPIFLLSNSITRRMCATAGRTRQLLPTISGLGTVGITPSDPAHTSPLIGMERQA